MSEEKKDPKEGADKEPSGNGQPEKSTDEKVEISKSELEKLTKKSKDFDGIVEARKNKDRTGRTIPGAESEKKEKVKSKPADDDDFDEDDDDDLKEEFVTKKDFQKDIEDSAKVELSKDPEIDAHWDEMLEYWYFKPGERNTVAGIVAAGKRALKVLKSEQPSLFEKPKEPEKKDDTDAKVKSELAKDSGSGKGKDKDIKPERKSIIPKQEKMEDWYGGKKK